MNMCIDKSGQHIHAGKIDFMQSYKLKDLLEKLIFGDRLQSNLKILVDKNIPKMTVNELKKLGFDVLDIRNTAKEGIPDQEVWEIALSQKRLLITTDKGFSKYRMQNHSGILIVRLQKPNRLKIHNKVIQTINSIDVNGWDNLIITVKDNVKTSWKKPDNFE